MNDIQNRKETLLQRLRNIFPQGFQENKDEPELESLVLAFLKEHEDEKVYDIKRELIEETFKEFLKSQNEKIFRAKYAELEKLETKEILGLLDSKLKELVKEIEEVIYKDITYKNTGLYIPAICQEIELYLESQLFDYISDDDLISDIPNFVLLLLADVKLPSETKNIIHWYAQTLMEVRHPERWNPFDPEALYELLELRADVLLK